MKQFIQNIIQKHGGRLPGSDAEQKAQDDFQQELKRFCHRVERHPFTAPMHSMLGSLRIFCWGFYISMILYLFFPILSFFVASINGILFIGHFYTYRFWLDFIFTQQPSSNVIGTIEPKKDVRSTLILAAHMDSAYEFSFWYYLKTIGMFLTLLSGSLIVLTPLLFGFDIFLTSVMGKESSILQTITYIFWILSPVTASMYWIHGKDAVDGAQDNLSGLAVALACGKELSPKNNNNESNYLNHTRIKIISFGSEEAGLRGSSAYIRDHIQELKKENAVLLNLEGIMKKDELVIVTSELSTFSKYPKWLIERMEKAFMDCNQPVNKSVHIIGATDGSAFVMNGLPAITIIGQCIHKLHESYHTRLDTPEHIEEEALEKTRDILISFVKAWDQDQTEKENH